MKTVAFTEFRQNASRLLDRVERGETVQIKRHGRVVAQLVGTVAATADTGPGKRRKATPAVALGKSLARMIIEERESRDDFIYRCLGGSKALSR